MMLVLSHLFGRIVCREADDKHMANIIRRSPSVVYLPPLPEKAANMLRQHNDSTLSIFATYVRTFAKQHMKGEDRILPLTNIQVGGQKPLETNVATAIKFDDHVRGSAHGNSVTSQMARLFKFLPTLPVPCARSAFVALSGHGDDFTTIADLCTSVRSGIFLESAVIPHLILYPDKSGMRLNAYLFDFFMHGSIKDLEEANGIRRGDMWFYLNDFSLVLATIVTSLAGYLGLGSGDVDEEILEVMGGGDVAENENDERMDEGKSGEDAAETSRVPSASLALSQQGIAIRRNMLDEVPDDWDVDEDTFEAQPVADEEDDVTAPQPQADDAEYMKMMKVYVAFKKLKAEFDAKFLDMWA